MARRLVQAAATLSLALTLSGQQADMPAYRNPDEKRAADLVGRMTLDEKVRQMQDQAPAIERLGVPAYGWWNEALHGVARAGEATVFPQAIGLAATWDTDLEQRIGDIISTEARAKYNDAIRRDSHARYSGLTFWSPNINIFRDPRWGRGQETFGEDPYLTGRSPWPSSKECRATIRITSRSSPPQSITPSIAGRNPTVTASTCIPASAT
jgi:beta-glucosidase